MVFMIMLVGIAKVRKQQKLTTTISALLNAIKTGIDTI